MIEVRTYGESGSQVVLLHGGPGAAGYLAPLARRLADEFRVLEPLQRGSGEEPLSVARHVDDLQDVLERHVSGPPPALVGHSWGAMLALAHAAEHPESVGRLVLIGCGTFDPVAREHLHENVERRLDDALRRRLQELPDAIPDPDLRLRSMGELLLPLYSHDLAAIELPLETCDARAHRETWDDAMRLQEEGLQPGVFAAIEAPVVLFHGSDDPHPGALIRDSLLPYLPRLAYREWERCGHYPWLERAARDDFLDELRRVLGGDQAA